MVAVSTPGRAFYDEQVRLLETQDIDGLVAQYHEDAVLVSFDFIIRGRRALRKHFEDYMQRLGSLRLISTDRFTETEDAIFFEATIETDLGQAKVYDVFILQEGLARRHFTGVIAVSPTSFPT